MGDTELRVVEHEIEAATEAAKAAAEVAANKLLKLESFKVDVAKQVAKRKATADAATGLQAHVAADREAEKKAAELKAAALAKRRGAAAASGSTAKV